LDEYYAVAEVLKLTAKGIAENTLANKNMNKYAFALNILEAVKLDIATGYRLRLVLTVSSAQQIHLLEKMVIAGNWESIYYNDAGSCHKN